MTCNHERRCFGTHAAAEDARVPSLLSVKDAQEVLLKWPMWLHLGTTSEALHQKCAQNSSVNSTAQYIPTDRLAEKQCSRRNRWLRWMKQKQTHGREAGTLRYEPLRRQKRTFFLSSCHTQGCNRNRHPSNHRAWSHSDRWSWWASLRCWFLV